MLPRLWSGLTPGLPLTRPGTRRSCRASAPGPPAVWPADGEIVNAQSFSHGEITASASGSAFSRQGEGLEDWWTLRMARQADFMALLVEKRIAHSADLSNWLAGSSAAKAQLAQIMNGDHLEEILGNTVGGHSTAALLAQTRTQVWGL